MLEPGQSGNRFPFILFDWGDTLMVDHPSMTASMAYWPKVEAVAGAAECLRAVKPGRLIGLATGAEVSTEAEIRTALARAGLDGLVERVFCFKNTGLRKPAAGFYRHIIEQLGARPGQVLMVGDSFEKDVAAPLALGMCAAWFNPRTAEERSGPGYSTIHRLVELPYLLLYD